MGGGKVNMGIKLDNLIKYFHEKMKFNFLLNAFQIKIFL